MSIKEHLDYIKEEWEFHKRHPELIVVWASYLYSLYLVFTNL